MTSIPEFPVFQLIGGNKELRREFTVRLVAELDRQALYASLLKCDERTSLSSVVSLVKQFDLVIVDGEIDFPMQRIIIGNRTEAKNGNLTWCGGDDRDLVEFVLKLIKELNKIARQAEVWACVLIGGRSSRMGRPKHLIEDGKGTTWLERTTEILYPLVDGLVVSGNGMLPEKLSSVTRLPDIPGVVGPLTGVIAASRWQPLVTWLLVACDMPHISTESVQWLLSERRAGAWGKVPRLAETDHCEPLFAWYDFRAAQLFEDQMYKGNLRIGGAAAHPKIENPVVPSSFRYAWQNFNSPDQVR